MRPPRTGFVSSIVTLAIGMLAAAGHARAQGSTRVAVDGWPQCAARAHGSGVVVECPASSYVGQSCAPSRLLEAELAPDPGLEQVLGCVSNDVVVALVLVAGGRPVWAAGVEDLVVMRADAMQLLDATDGAADHEVRELVVWYTVEDGESFEVYAWRLGGLHRVLDAQTLSQGMGNIDARELRIVWGRGSAAEIELVRREGRALPSVRFVWDAAAFRYTRARTRPR